MAPPEFPLLRWISLMGDQLGEMEALLDRIDARSLEEGGDGTEVSALADPAAADPGWLEWLGRFVGVVPGDLSTSERRSAVAAAAVQRPGSRSSIAAAAATALTGSRDVLVRDHFGGDQWRIEVRTRVSQTPDPAAVLDAIARARVKPAGTEIVLTGYEASWEVLEAQRPTWAEWDGNTWTTIEETGAP
jgi:hypothetical protein